MNKVLLALIGFSIVNFSQTYARHHDGQKSRRRLKNLVKRGKMAEMAHEVQAGIYKHYYKLSRQDRRRIWRKLNRTLRIFKKYEIQNPPGGGNPPPRPGRLQNGDIRIWPNGRLEYLNSGLWGGICARNFTRAMGVVACRQLGGRYIGFSAHHRNPSPGLVKIGHCSGHERGLWKCRRNIIRRGICGKNQGQVFISCRGHRNHPDAGMNIGNREGNIRLVGRNNILEVYHNRTWLPVCDDNFNAKTGKVACRQMGLIYRSHRTAQSHPHRSDSRYWIDDLTCRGHESKITDCSRNLWGKHNCVTNEKVSLTCE